MSAAASLHAPRLRILYLHSTHAHSVVHALHASMLAAHHTLAPAMRCSMQIALFIKITMHGFNPFEQPIYFFVKWQPCSSTKNTRQAGTDRRTMEVPQLEHAREARWQHLA